MLGVTGSQEHRLAKGGSHKSGTLSSCSFENIEVGFTFRKKSLL